MVIYIVGTFIYLFWPL